MITAGESLGADKNQNENENENQIQLQLPKAWSLENEELDSTPCHLPPRCIAYGDSHTQAKRIFQSDPDPDIQATRLIIIFLGTNDSVLPHHLTHVPLDEYENNLECIITHLSSIYPSATIFLLTPPPICDKTAGLASPGKFVNSVVAKYRDACLRVGSRMGVSIVDVYAALGSGNQEQAGKCLWYDGVHLGPEGSRRLFEEVVRTLNTHHSSLSVCDGLNPSVRKMKILGPRWSKFSEKDSQWLVKKLDKLNIDEP